MMDENENVGSDEGLDAEATAYFESRGETLTAPEPEKKPDTATPEPEGGDPDAEAAAAIEGKQQPTVPLRSLQEEREERKRLRDELENFKREHAVLTDRWNTLLNMGNQPAKDEPPAPPDPEQDIFAFAKWQQEQLNQLRQQVQSKDDAERQASEAKQEEDRIWNFWESSAQVFASKPEGKDFVDAAKWLSSFRHNQLQALSVVQPQFADVKSRNAQIEAELKEIVIAAAQRGGSPAELVYAIAKGYGYAGPAKKEDPGAAIEKINANRDAEISLSGTGGEATNRSGPKSAEDVASMSPAEFERWLAASPNNFKRIAGGA